jgi:hypothetical protein
LQGLNATGTTIQPGDVINGGAGTDTLNITIAGAAAATAISAVQTNSVERVLVNNFSTDAGINAISTDLMNGLTTVGLQASSETGDTSFTGMRALVGAEMRNGSGDLTLTYAAAAVAGTADTQALTVSNLSGGTFTANGAETIAVTSELVKSKITNVSSDNLKTVTVAGAADLEITGSVAATTVDASTMTGGLTVTLGTADQKVTGGSGNDVFSISRANLTADDVIVGGLGVDTLKITAVGGVVDYGTSAAKGKLWGVSDVEVIDIASTNNAATLNLDGTSGVTTVVAAANTKTVTFTGNNANTAAEKIKFTLNGVAGETAATVDFTGDAAADVAAANAALTTAINAISGFTASSGTTGPVTVVATSGEVVELAITAGSANTFTAAVSDYSDVAFTNLTTQSVDILSAANVTASLKDASGSDDVLNINLKTVSADKDFNHAIGIVRVDNVETINLSATGMSDGKVKTVNTLTANAMKTLNITGDSDLTISNFTGSEAVATIDGSTSTGDLNLTIADLAANLPDARTIKTGAGNDVINMGAFLTKDVTIDGGGNSVIAGDTKTGKDLVTATGAIGTIVTAAALKIANVENIEIATAGESNFIDAAGITGAESIAFSSTGGTVKITNLAAGTAIGLGIGAVEANATTFDLALADATGDADSITIAYSDTIDVNTSNTLKIASTVETLNIVATKESATATTQTLVNTDMAAKNIVVTAGHSGDTLALGTLNKATTNVNASAYQGMLTVITAAEGAVTVSANGGRENNITTGAGADTITLVGAIGILNHTINGGGGKNVLNVTLDAADTNFTNITNIETINMTVGGNKQVTFIDETKDNGLNAATTVNILGGDSLSTFTVGTAANINVNTAATTIDASTFGGAVDLLVATGGLNSFLTIKGGASTKDVVRTTVSDETSGAKVAAMSGIETLVVTSTDNNATSSAIDLSNVTGLTTIDAVFAGAGNADKITLSNVASGVKITVASTAANDNLIVDLTDKSAANNTLDLELKSFGAVADTLNFDAAGVETLNISAKNANAGLIDLAGVTATETEGKVTVNVSGSGALTLSALSSQTNVVNASAATGAITLESGARAATAMTITGGTGDDTISMRNAGDVLNAGLGNDTLKVNANFILGGIQVDLSSTTDQVTTFNGSANAAAQIGFENVDLSGVTGAFGADITAAATGSIITGTANADNIIGGAGNDTIIVASEGAANNDVMNGGGGANKLVLETGAHVFATDANLVNIQTIELVGTAGVTLTNQTEGFVIESGVGANAITLGSGRDTIKMDLATEFGGHHYRFLHLVMLVIFLT